MMFALAYMIVNLNAIGVANQSDKAEIVEVKKIWDKAPHNAFTDLARFKNRWFCVFREGQAHVSPDGALRVISSPDGEKWTSEALISSPIADLRDAKITITPDGRLMLSGAAAFNPPAKFRHQSMIWYSDDGKNWSDAIDFGDPNMWIWRTTWHKGISYGIGRNTTGENIFRLYISRDGKKYDILADNLFGKGHPNENTMIFLDDDTCYCLVRREAAPDNSALLGIAKPPYTQWEWKDLGVRVGGPNMLRLPDGRIVAACRLYDNAVRTSLLWLDPEAGTMTEFLKLPSGGDTSYAGLVLYEGLLWISYYSSHEGKTSIYLAKVKLPL